MIRKRLFSTEGKIKPMYFLSEVLSQKFTQKTNISMPILFVIQTDSDDLPKYEKYHISLCCII